MSLQSIVASTGIDDPKGALLFNKDGVLGC